MSFDRMFLAESCDYPIDIYCWAYCIFSTPEDKAIHDAAGEVCDYAAMKAEVLADLVTGGLSSSVRHRLVVAGVA